MEPLVIVLAVTAVTYWLEFRGGWALLHPYLERSHSDLYSTVAGLSGSLLGFVIAALAITVTTLSSTRLEVVQQHMRTLIATFSVGTAYLGFGTLAALAALVFDHDGRPARWLFYSVLLFLSLSALGLVRCVWVLHNVVSIVSDPSKSRAGDE